MFSRSSQSKIPRSSRNDTLLRLRPDDRAALAAAGRNAEMESQPALLSDVNACVAALEKIAAEPEKLADLQELENYLSVLEEKLTASVTRAAPVERLAQIHREVDRELVPYRQKMTGPQIESSERQFLNQCLYEYYRIPRLSLFYL